MEQLQKLWGLKSKIEGLAGEGEFNWPKGAKGARRWWKEPMYEAVTLFSGSDF